jgi:hypothetical protein
MAKRSKKKRPSSTARASQENNHEILLSDRNSIFVILFILAVGVIGYIYIFDKKLDLNGDNAAYYLLGKALAKGEGFVSIWNVGKPPHQHFPPGYPAILSLIMFFFSDNVITIKIVNGLFFFSSIVVLFLLFNRFKAGLQLAAIAAVAIAVNSQLLRYATIMMSEIPFLFFSTLALYLATKIDFTKKPHKEKLFLALMLCLGAAYYIRTLGLAVVFGIIFYFILRKKWAYFALTAIGFFALAVPWFIRGRMLGGNPYLNQLIMVNPYDPELGVMGMADVAKRFFNNLVRYVSIEIPNGCLPFLEKAIYARPVAGWIVGMALLGLLIYGIMRLKSYQTLVIGYLAGTLGITLLWPEVWYGVRFIIAVVPLLVFLILYGLYEFLKSMAAKIRLSSKLSPVFLSPLLLFYLFSLEEQHLVARNPYPPNWLNYFQIANWVKANTPPNTILSCRKGEFFYLFAERPVTGYAFTRDDQLLIQKLREQKVNYVVVDQLGFGSTPQYLVPAIQKNQNLFRVILHLQNPDTYLLEFLQP